LPKDLQSLAHFQEETDYYRIFFLESTSSTNDHAEKLAMENHPHGTVVIADHQKSGRGRHGRGWYSPPGVNIYMSIILRPENLPFSPTLLSIATSLAVVKALRQVLSGKQTVEEWPEDKISGASSEGSSVEIWPKWPNDIYCGERKLGGILIEASTKGGKAGPIIIGIGVNVNLEWDALPGYLQGSTTSLYMIKGSYTERGPVAINILNSFRKYYHLMFSDPSSIIDTWSEMSHMINRYVRAVTPSGVIEGKVTGLDSRGFLRLQKRDGKEVSLSSAEIIQLGQNGNLRRG
jgi:BirA family biotin operon repressor/biotin-[acetyl-CoA-carboxylase] ligase